MSALWASPILPQGLDDPPPPPPPLPPYLKVWICHCWKSCVSALQARPGQTATMVFIFICLPQYPLTCWQSKTVAEHWHGFQSSKVHWCWNLDLGTTQKRTRCLRRLLQTSQDKGAVGKKIHLSNSLTFLFVWSSVYTETFGVFGNALKSGDVWKAEVYRWVSSKSWCR